jgi:hypothetical protein
MLSAMKFLAAAALAITITSAKASESNLYLKKLLNDS